MSQHAPLKQIEPFLGTVMDAVEPRQRRRLADRLMRMVRRAQAKRIGQNVEPDGTKMRARRPRKGKRGKMFRHLGKAKNLKIRTTPDSGELFFANPNVADTAATHHYGRKGYVGRTRDGRIIRTKYDARRLLGFGKEQDELLDEVLRHMSD